MPLNGAGLAAKPAGTTAAPDTTILSAAFNSVIDDLYAILNTTRPIAYGGTGGTSLITGWDGLAAKGTDIATASSIDLTTATGPSLTLTGVVTVTAVTLAEGSIRLVRAASAFQITASASLLCNGSSSSNMAVTAEDLLVFRGGASSVVTVSKVGASAASLTAQGVVELATVAEALTGTDAVRAVTPAGLYYPTGHLYNLLLTNDAGDATNDINVAAGTARDSGDTANMALASAIIKRLDANWAVGTNQGGLDTGSAAISTKYFVWLIKRSDTAVVDVLLSASGTAPTMPTNYDLKRLVGSFYRNASGVNMYPRGYSKEADFADSVMKKFTASFTAFGTVVTQDMWGCRVGDCWTVLGKFTAATSTAAEAQMTMGMNGTNSNIVSDPTKVASIRDVGSGSVGVAATQQFRVLIESAVGYLTFGIQNSGAGGLAKANGSDIVSSSAFGFSVARVPVAGW